MKHLEEFFVVFFDHSTPWNLLGWNIWNAKVTPPKTNILHLKMGAPWKRRFLLETIISRFQPLFFGGVYLLTVVFVYWSQYTHGIPFFPLINIYLWYKWIIQTLTIAPKFQTKIHLIDWRLGSPSKLFVEKSQESGVKLREFQKWTQYKLPETNT